MLRPLPGALCVALVLSLSLVVGCQPPAAKPKRSTTTMTIEPSAPPVEKTADETPPAEAAPTEKPVEETTPAEPPKEADPMETKKADPASQAAVSSVPLIPRKAFFGNPEKAHARLSPDGKQLAFLAPLDGVLNVWVGPVDDIKAAKAVTKDTHRGIRGFFWAYTSNHILYSQDKDGDEDNHVYSINLETGEIKDLTPIEKIAAQIEGVSEKFPEEILVGINDRGERQ